jgi:hypothetical protein
MDAVGDRPLPDNQHIKLYEVQVRETENYVEPYPTLKEAYFQTRYWFPSSLKVENWRLIWQYCGESGVYGNESHTYGPQISLMLVAPEYGDGLRFNIHGYYFPDQSVDQGQEIIIKKLSEIPRDQWNTLEVYVKQGSKFRVLDGSVKIWLNGKKIFEANDLPTATYSGTPYVIWGIGNYGGGEELFGQSILMKDVVVSSEFIP